MLVAFTQPAGAVTVVLAAVATMPTSMLPLVLAAGSVGVMLVTALCERYVPAWTFTIAADALGARSESTSIAAAQRTTRSAPTAAVERPSRVAFAPLVVPTHRACFPGTVNSLPALPGVSIDASAISNPKPAPSRQAPLRA